MVTSTPSNPVQSGVAWLNANWQYAGLVGGLFYLALLPLSAHGRTISDWLLYLQLPLYIVHQLEEHFHDRFRRYINLTLGHGLEVLTPGAVTVINILGVWCVDFAALYLARFEHPKWALLAFYLAVVNALIHILGSLAQRAYNPGLVTAVLLLLPIGCWGIAALSHSDAVPLIAHITCCGLIVAMHAGMIVYALRRKALLTAV